MKTESPWYWEYANYDHDAVGLVACAGPNSLTHYANVYGRAACGQKVKSPRLLDGPRIVECRNCCALARGPNRGRIAQRENVRPVILGASRMAFTSRERARKAR